MALNCVAVVLLSLLLATIAESLSSKIWLSTSDGHNRLGKQSDAQFLSDGFANEYVVDVDNSVQFQEMDGYGASLTDSSAWLIQYKMNDQQREALLQDLFNPVTGLGLNILRQPMGASDFALRDYTYDDTCCDTNDFSIDYDRKYIIPLLKRIKQINPDLLIIGTPWSAPAWMKTSNKLHEGRLASNHYQNYADYFVKFIKAYEKEGLPIYAITCQNEPAFEPKGYPGMLMNSAEQTNFIKSYLGPAFKKNGISTKILAWDHNWDQYQYPLDLLADATAKSYVAGTAFHCYGGAINAQTIVKNAHPDKEIWQTECSGGEWNNGANFGTQMQSILGNEIIRGAQNWGKTVLKWNLALDEKNGPTNGGCKTCFGTVKINSGNGQVTPDGQYYLLGHASKVIRKGAHRVQSTSFENQLETVAFQNRDGSMSLLAYNKGSNRINFKVRQGSTSFTYGLDSGAASSFLWPKPTSTARSAFAQIEAEGYTEIQGGGGLESCQDESGCGSNVGYTSDGTTLVFKNVDFGSTGANRVALRVATDSDQSGAIEFRSGCKTCELLASVSVSKSGGWKNWKTVSDSAKQPITGIRDVYVVFKKSVNLNWFRFYDSPLLQGKTYKIASKLSGKVLDIKDNQKSAGATIQQWDSFDADNQKFQLNAVGDGYYEMLILSSGKVLEVGSNDNAALVKSADKNGQQSQHWKISEAQPGFFSLVNRKSGKAMDVKDRSKDNGALIQVWDYYGGDAQLWVVVPV